MVSQTDYSTTVEEILKKSESFEDRHDIPWQICKRNPKAILLKKGPSLQFVGAYQISQFLRQEGHERIYLNDSRVRATGFSTGYMLMWAKDITEIATAMETLLGTFPDLEARSVPSIKTPEHGYEEEFFLALGSYRISLQSLKVKDGYLHETSRHSFFTEPRFVEEYFPAGVPEILAKILYPKHHFKHGPCAMLEYQTNKVVALMEEKGEPVHCMDMTNSRVSNYWQIRATIDLERSKIYQEHPKDLVRMVYTPAQEKQELLLGRELRYIWSPLDRRTYLHPKLRTGIIHRQFKNQVYHEPVRESRKSRSRVEKHRRSRDKSSSLMKPRLKSKVARYSHEHSESK